MNSDNSRFAHYRKRDRERERKREREREKEGEREREREKENTLLIERINLQHHVGHEAPLLVHEPDKCFITSRGTKRHQVYQQAYYPYASYYVYDSSQDLVA